jgi:hypothetical protein
MNRTWVKTIAAIGVILLAGAFYMFFDKRRAYQPQTGSPNAQTQANDFSVKPTEPLQFSCGAPRLPERTDGIWVSPQGQFCVLAVTAENVTREKRTFTGDGTRLLGDDGKTYMLDLYTMSFTNSSWVDLEPRVPIETSFVFDIPQGVTPTSIELRNHPKQQPKTVAIPK